MGITEIVLIIVGVVSIISTLYLIGITFALFKMVSQIHHQISHTQKQLQRLDNDVQSTEEPGNKLVDTLIELVVVGISFWKKYKKRK